MSARTTFRFEAAGISFELSGSTEFVRRHLETFLPFVNRVAGTSGSKGDAGTRTGSRPVDLGSWYTQHVPDGVRLTMQDNILVFALWMRSFKKYIFTSEDIRRGFADVGQPEPKSLLQILGTLKRDHNLILGTDRRGEYMLNTTGIDRARKLLGIPVSKPKERPSQPEAPSGDADIASARAALGL